MDKQALYTNITLKDLPDSEIVITGEVPAETLVHYNARALKNLGEHVTLPGFRKGHIPERVLKSALGEVAILEEAALLTLADAYPVILKEHGIDALGRPRITITKLAPGNPLGFSLETAVVPPVSLPDYAAIARKIAQPEDLAVEEKEVEEALRHIRENVAHNRNTQSNTTGNAKEPSHETAAQLPELTDAFVREIGDFKDVADFREKLTERMREEKRLRAEENKRISIADELVAASKVVVPKILLEGELGKMLGRLKEDLRQAEISFNEYLSRLKKTEEDIRDDWKEEAAKRAKLQLVLNAIAEKEKIITPSEEIERQSATVLEHNKDADPENVRAYVETMLINEEVFRFLEKQR